MVGGLYDCWPISGLTGYYNTRMAVPCYLDIAITPEPDASSTSGTLSFALATDIGLDMDTKLHTIINECSIPGTGTYAGREFDYALRWNMAGANGTPVSFGSSPETIIIELDYTIDSDWVWDELYLTTFVQSNATKEILNSHMIKMTDLVTTSIHNESSGAVDFSVTSPVYGAISYSVTQLEGQGTMSLFSLDGRLINSTSVQNGNNLFTPEVSGVYILRLQSPSGFSLSKSVVVLK